MQLDVWNDLAKAKRRRTEKNVLNDLAKAKRRRTEKKANPWHSNGAPNQFRKPDRQLFFRPSPLWFRQVDQNASA